MTTAGWILMILWTVITVAVAGAVIYWLAVNLGVTKRPGPPDDSARELLDRRLAAGELTVDEYTELRETLGDGRESSAATASTRPPPSASSSRPARA